MLSFFANIFGYVLQLLYNIVGNYGWAIILFSVLVKAIMIPISIKQQRTMKKNQKIQEEVKQIQFKYKNEPEKMNQEMMALYKREGMSPFSGCLSSIIQIVLLFSVFLLVRQPLTYMVKMDTDVISKMENVITEQEEGNKNAYAEIAVIQYVNNLDNKTSVSKDESFDMKEYAEQANLNMDFFGIDLSQVPKNNWKDFKVLIIPILYIISSFVSIRLSMNTNNKQNKEKKLITDGKEQEEEKYNPMDDANKTMVWMMPIMSVSIAAIAPLGLALYWLMNNILMIVERLVYNKIFEKEEAEKNA
ncbi:MAG: YidC/Oxa1 family membrane protein insertase [Clostridia bacterium]|nr:YidC/Oxa1 family membrane protein insertase [Clostridia bacterium]